MIWKNSIKTCIVSRVKQITSPGWMHETSAQGWCTGKTRRDGMGREAGRGGLGWGTDVNPWLIHVSVWQKPLQYCKIISLQLIKINEKKRDFSQIEWNKSPSSQSYGFSSSHVWMWELDHKESWVPENWCFWTLVLEKTLESPLDCKEIKPINPNGNQSWIFIGRTDAEAGALILWLPDGKNWVTGKDPDAGKDWR